MAGKRKPKMCPHLASYFRKEAVARLHSPYKPFIVTEAEMRAHIKWMREHGKVSHFEAPK